MKTSLSRRADWHQGVKPSLRERLASTNLRLAVQDIPVQAVTNYSVGYSKQVFWSIIAAAKKWQEDDASAMAAGVAYYLALSLFPSCSC